MKIVKWHLACLVLLCICAVEISGKGGRGGGGRGGSRGSSSRGSSSSSKSSSSSSSKGGNWFSRLFSSSSSSKTPASSSSSSSSVPKNSYPKQPANNPHYNSNHAPPPYSSVGHDRPPSYSSLYPSAGGSSSHNTWSSGHNNWNSGPRPQSNFGMFTPQSTGMTINNFFSCKIQIFFIIPISNSLSTVLPLYPYSNSASYPLP